VTRARWRSVAPRTPAPRAASGEAAAQLFHVSKSYVAGTYALRDVSLEFGKGEFVFLTGPSGAGKTSLLRLVFAADRPSEGQIVVLGRNASRLSARSVPELRRRIGVVFQDFKLLARRTVEENVALALDVVGTPRRVARTRVFEVLKQVGLQHRRYQSPLSLSGGEQQRVAIARALVQDAPLIVADEPTAHLDYVQVEGVLELIRGLAVSGRLLVVATHDDRLTPVADHVIDLSPQRKVAAGTREVRVAAGEHLFEMGDHADLVYAVKEGEIELYRPLATGGEELLVRRGPGAYFGELGPLLGLPRSTSARATTDTVLTGYGPQEFRRSRATIKASAPGRGPEATSELEHTRR
jgi:putative ABC transport system ATP-binding protein